MTQRDLDDAVARLRAAASRPDPAAADLSPDLGPPRGRPETAGQGPLDPDTVDAHAHVVTGHEAPPPDGSGYPRTDWRQPLPTDALVASPAPRRAAQPGPAAAPQIDPQDRRGRPRAATSEAGDYSADGAGHGREEEARGLPRLPAFLRRGRAEPAAAPAAPVGDARASPAPQDAGSIPREAWPDEEAPRRRLRPGGKRHASGRGRPEGHAPLTPRERRWQRRRRRYLMEEILGWLLVPVIVVGLYWAVVWGLSVFNLTVDDIVAGAQQAWDAFQAR